jgi:organic radical activating enzyme
MRVSAIYPTYQGETNLHGIGAPVIFLRLQGCHLRCYKKTMGVLCDTPEALSREDVSDEIAKDLSAEEIVQALVFLRDKTGINLICLSGGDPLWQNKKDLHNLLSLIVKHEFLVSIETSGTISIAPYSDIPNLYWVLDYKTKSAGIEVPFIWKDLSLLTTKDWVKFIVYDHKDLEEALITIRALLDNSYAKISIGPYWGGAMTVQELYIELLASKLFEGGRVQLNVQLHKLNTLYDSLLQANMIGEVVIPKKI